MRKTGKAMVFFRRHGDRGKADAVRRVIGEVFAVFFIDDTVKAIDRNNIYERVVFQCHREAVAAFARIFHGAAAVERVLQNIAQKRAEVRFKDGYFFGEGYFPLESDAVAGKKLGIII